MKNRYALFLTYGLLNEAPEQEWKTVILNGIDNITGRVVQIRGRLKFV